MPFLLCFTEVYIPSMSPLVLIALEYFAGFENMALESAGANCTSSSAHFSNPCVLAIDGLVPSYWLSNIKGVGEDIWIQVDLSNETIVYRLDLKTRPYYYTLIDTVFLVFTDGIRLKVGSYHI